MQRTFPTNQAEGPLAAGASAGPFRLVERVYPPHHRLGPHAHERPTLLIVVQGSVAEYVDGRCYACTPWSVLAKPAKKPHDDRFGAEGARCLSIELLAAPRLLDRVLFTPAGRFVSLLQLIYQELRFPDAFSSLALQGFILELMASFARESTLGASVEGPEWLRRAEALIRERFSEPLRMSELAVELGVHPAHFARVFRRSLGVSPSAYVKQLRVSWAKQQLARTTRPLADIALAAGFSDQSHLTRSFTREIGLTPSRYRKLCRASGQANGVQKPALDRF